MESSGHAAAALGAFQQAEFLAEDELIEISPMVVSGTVALVCGDFGPFEPSIATKVPLWLALAMKKLRRCRIIPPRWLALREVERCIQDEREQEGRLQPLPRFFSQTTVRDRMNAIKVNNLTSLEVETHRPVLTRVLDGLYSMHVSDLDVDPATQSASAGTSSAATGQQRPLRRIIRRT